MFASVTQTRLECIELARLDAIASRCLEAFEFYVKFLFHPGDCWAISALIELTSQFVTQVADTEKWAVRHI